MRTDVLLGLTVGGVIAIGVAVTMVGGVPQPANRDPRTSTLVAGPDGSQALHEALAELGVPVVRRRTPLFDLTDRGGVGVLAVLAPPEDLLGEELSEVARYVRDGGAAVVAGEGGGITACAGYEAARADSGWMVDGSLPGDLGRPVAVLAPRHAPHLPPARRVLVPLVIEEGFERPAVRRRQEAECGLLVPVAVDTMLAARDGRPVVLALTFRGGGRIVFVSDPVYLRNRAWRETDAPYFMLPLLIPGAERRGPLVWDEYHQGFADATRGATGVLWEWLRRSPAGWAILQLSAVVLVWLAVTAVRFGPARPAIERRRRSPLEHVDALAAGLEGAQGADTAVDLIISGLRRRLSRTGHIPSGDVAGWLAALQLALPTTRGRSAARTLQRIRSEPGGVERVLAAAQAVEDVWQDLRPASIPARL